MSTSKVRVKLIAYEVSLDREPVGAHLATLTPLETLSRQSSQKIQIKKQFVFFTIVHPRHHPRVFFLVFSFRGPTARCSVFWCKNRCLYPPRPFASLATFLGWDPSWCTVTPSFVEPPTAGCQRVFSWVASLLSSSHTWEARMWSATGGAQETGGSLFAPQSSCPGSSRRQESHLLYTSVGLLRQPPARRNP